MLILKKVGLVAVMAITCILSVKMLGGNTIGSEVATPKKHMESVSIKNDDKNKSNNKDKSVYGTISMNRNWVIDPTDTKRVLTELDNIVVVKAKVTSIEKPLFLNTKEIREVSYPVTPVNISIEEVLLGDNINNLDKIYLTGGRVTISEAMEVISEGDAEKLGYDKLPSNELNTTYVDYVSDYDYKLNPLDEYIFILAKQSNNTYEVLGNGYGIFTEDNSKSKVKSDVSGQKIAYKNVLSQKELIIPDKNN